MIEPIIRLQNVDVHLNGKSILHRIDWELRPAQHWAILGPNGSGKSTFLKLVRGVIGPVPCNNAKRVYFLNGRRQGTAVGLREKIGWVSPELQDRYLQQEWTLTARDVVHSGFLDTDYVQVRPSPAQRRRAHALAKRFGIERLLNRNVQELSTGELRRVLIVRAFVSKPVILILDEVCDSLDAGARRQLLELIERIAAAGTQLLFTTHRAGELPQAITHLAIFENGSILSQGPRSEHLPTPAVTLRHKEWNRKEITRSTRDEAASPALSRPIITLGGANVFLGRKRVLTNVHWQMRAGENWAILGRNGAGKSTFLKLAVGDLHPTWGSRVERFDLTSRDTLWDLRKKVGFISPELQASYREDLTGGEVVASGFFSSVGLVNRVTRSQKSRVNQLFAQFEGEDLAIKPVLQMSYGAFRKVLLLRALVQKPALLICDEPFDGLDQASKCEFSSVLDHAARQGTHLILVTHHLEDLPNAITHVLFLEKGRVVCQGSKRKLWKHPVIKRLFGRD